MNEDDDNKIRLSLNTFIALKNDTSRTSRGYFDLSKTEEYLAKLTMSHNDMLLFPTMADKKTWYSMKGLKLFHDVVTRYSYDTTTNTFVDGGVMRYSARALDFLHNTFVGEIHTVIAYYENIEKVENNPALRRDNYHGKIKNGTMDNRGNGGYMRYCTEFVSPQPEQQAEQQAEQATSFSNTQTPVKRVYINEEISQILNGTEGTIQQRRQAVVDFLETYLQDEDAIKYSMNYIM
ncbi:MAG: hypothetical protein EOM41_08165 [Bacilli bacterium]|nr:hypothetical protein [Bacilli bacterium]